MTRLPDSEAHTRNESTPNWTRVLGYLVIDAQRERGFWRRRRLKREIHAFARIVNAIYEEAANND